MADGLGEREGVAQGVGVLVAQVVREGEMDGLPEVDCVDEWDCDRVMLPQALGVRLGVELVLPV